MSQNHTILHQSNQNNAHHFAARVSFVVSFFVLALKLAGYLQTHSTAILSDALETIVNVVTATVAMVVLKYALEPADESHPYGHGKLEFFSAAFEGGIILFAAIAIVFESIRNIILGYQVENILIGMSYVLVATVINLLVGLYLLRTAKKLNSETLKASGLHLLSDVKTTAGVVVGLILYWLTGYKWIDSAVGILVGFWLGYESIQLIKTNIGGLLDESDFESIKELADPIQQNLFEGIIDVHNLRVIRSGSFHHIDAHVVMPDFWNVKKVHDLAHDFEKNVVKQYKYQGEFAFHVDPCKKRFCRICTVQNCPDRVKDFEATRKLTAEHMIKGPQYED